MAVVPTRVRLPLAASPHLSWSRCLLAALPAWLVARAIVLVTFGLVDADGLDIWDAAWYRDLGEHGYGPYGEHGSRFFPLLPLIGRAGHLLRLPVGGWLLAVCWVSALLFAAALYRLTVLETGDLAAGRRAAWLIQLLPGANVLAVGYTEAVAGLLAVLYFLALRTRTDAGPGLVVGVLGGLARPTGLLLAIPAAVQALRSRSGRLALLALGPLLGAAAYLAWTWWAFGDPLTPYRVQSAEDLRGGVVRAPWEFLTEKSLGGYPWQFLLALLAVAAFALLLTAQRLPVAYVAWTLPMVGLAVTGWGLHSVPRYLAAVFPLWMAVAIVCRNRWVWLPILVLSTAGFTWVTYLNFDPAGPVP